MAVAPELTHDLCRCEFCPRPGEFDGKCATHRYRQRCSVPDCLNQSYAKSLCVQHGGKPVCQVDGCGANARRFGYCSKHSHRGKKQCGSKGCTNVSYARGRCVRHGGGRQCQWIGCDQYSRHEGYCQRHFRAWVNQFRAFVPLPLAISEEEMDMLRFFFADDDE